MSNLHATAADYVNSTEFTPNEDGILVDSFGLTAEEWLAEYQEQPAPAPVVSDQHYDEIPF